MYLKNGSRILDVGTGTGKQVFAFAKKGTGFFDILAVFLKEHAVFVPVSVEALLFILFLFHYPWCRYT